MRNWNIDTSQFDKNSNEYKNWKLEQLINFGLQGEKIDAKELRSRLNQLTLDPSKKRYLKFILSHVATD